MSWSEDESAAAVSEPPADESASQSALFPGDVGELPLDTRRALVQLLSGPSLDGRLHPKLWTVLLQDEASLRKRLCELFLDLVVDPDQQVAFIRQADVKDLDVPILLRKAPLTFVESALILFLRQRLASADANSERAVVSKPELAEHLLVYERSSNTDHVGFSKRVRAAIEKFKKYNILRKLRGSEDRFEVSPTLKLLFSAEEILALTKIYSSMASDYKPNTLAADSPQHEDEL